MSKFITIWLTLFYSCPTLVHAYVSISKAVLSNPSYKAKFDLLFYDIEKPHEDLDELYSSNEGSCDIKLPVDENLTLLEDVHVLPSDSEDDELDDVDEEDSN